MARQRRIAVSLPAEIHWRLRQLEKIGVGPNDSALVGKMINVLADHYGIPTISRTEALAERAKEGLRVEDPEQTKIASQYFSF